MKRIWVNFQYILGVSVKYTGIIFALLGFIGMFAPLSDIISANLSIGKRICISCLILLGTWMCVFILSCLYICHKNIYELFDVGNGHHVYVKYGDLFLGVESKGAVPRNIVVPVNRCFDTIVDDDLISSRTLHGICMNGLYSKKKYTQGELNKKIQNMLSEKKIGYKKISKSEKRKGNLKRFEPGTIVEIQGDEETTYFLLGLTTFDNDLHAHTSDDEYVLAMMRMLMYNNKRSQGKALFIPLIGAGAADTRKSERDILEYLVKLIKMNRMLVNCDIYIVVRENAKGSVAITDL